MSSSTRAENDDDVEFVSEAPLRPVLQCIDLMSEGEDDETMAETIEDEIERQKAHVSSTLDRLSRQVELTKRERAEKCKAFNEKQMSQKAHGKQGLAISAARHADDAKHCVNMWLNMPGVRNSGIGGWRKSALPPPRKSATQTCPVINCGRVYDNVPLLEGHLKRFDHSPCDPTIYLRGCQAELQACVACGLHFPTKEAWKVHQRSKLSSSDQLHNSIQSSQSIVCFACPACYLLFYIRDECLQHMSAENHHSQAIVMSETKGTALPVPIPRYAKNRLIALCKEVSFTVRCTTCKKAIHSHMEAQAHFNVLCRHGSARVEAEKSVAQVMRQLQAFGQCYECCQLFTKPGQVDRHKELNLHDAEVNRTMDRAILHYCNFYEIQNAKRASTAGASGPRQLKGSVTASQTHKNESDSAQSPAKRQRLGGSLSGSSRLAGSRLAWFCECGQRFSEEAMANKHLLAANQIFHQCCVCGKHMGEESITRLHMSRFHGGAHLSNYLFHCRLCKVDMPRRQDILLHVAESHGGHTFFREREVPPDEPAPIPYAKPSTSGEPRAAAESRGTSATVPAPPKQGERWMCRMCEDVFDTERDVHEHCSDVRAHSFQRFVCGHCPQKFFKEATLRRHCANEHGGATVMHYFCGLCDSMQYDTEEEFQQHYTDLHSKDYHHMEEPQGPPEAPDPSCSQQTPTKASGKCPCPCMSFSKDKAERKATFTRCVKRLSREDRCSFVCVPCDVRVPSFALIMTHVHTKHDALKLEKTFSVVCGSCQESHIDVPSFHTHYHSQHCPLDPCINSGGGGRIRSASSTGHKTLNAVKTTHSLENDDSDEGIKRGLALSEEEATGSGHVDLEMEEALKRSLLEY